MKYILIKCDIVLMKYLLTQPEIKEQFNIHNISLLSDIASSNNIFNDLMNENLNINHFEFLGKTEENNLRYINSILEFLYLIIRDNLSMEKIAFRCINWRMNMKDEIYEQLDQNEKDKIINLVKNEIVHLF